MVELPDDAQGLPIRQQVMKYLAEQFPRATLADHQFGADGLLVIFDAFAARLRAEANHRDGKADESSGSPCSAAMSVDLCRDDMEGPVPHAFPCRLRDGHEENGPDQRPHEALVTWWSPED